MVETNMIKEIYPGHHHVILDFPRLADVEHMLDESAPYVWITNHKEYRTSWEDYQHTLYGKLMTGTPVRARNMVMEYLIRSEDFKSLIPLINQSLHLVQMKTPPPDYLRLSQITGKAKYDLLDKCGYTMEIQIPAAADYSPVVSPDKAHLQRIIDHFG